MLFSFFNNFKSVVAALFFFFHIFFVLFDFYTYF